MSGFRRALALLAIGLASCCPVAWDRFTEGYPGGILGGKPPDYASEGTVKPTPDPTTPLEQVPAGDQALHIAIAKGYLSGQRGRLNWARKFQVRVDGRTIWQGWLSFGDEGGPSKPEVAWLPAPVLTSRGPHEFRIYDVTLGTEIAGTYSCAHPQCWAVVTYAKDKRTLDLIEFLDEQPRFEGGQN